MIQDFESQNEDFFSLAGRLSLIGGGAYSVAKTARDLRNPINRPINPNAQTFQKRISRLRNIKSSTAAPLTMDAALSETIPFSEIFGNTRELYHQNRLRFQKTNATLFSNLGTGYKGRSAALGQQLSGLVGDLRGAGFTHIDILKKMTGGEIGQIRIASEFGGRKYFFDVNPISESGSMFIGENLQNKFAARSVVGQYDLSKDISQSTIQVIGSDVALVQKYRSELENIKSGVLDPRTLSEKIIEKSIFEESRLGEGVASAKASDDLLGILRREQAVVDPFDEMGLFGKHTVMRNLTRVPGYGAGSAAQFAKGVLSTPDSPLNMGIPGAEKSATSYQLFRMSKFDESVKPSVDWFGSQTGIGEFTYAQIQDEQQFKRVLKEMYPSVGEVAAEELLMNKFRNVGIRNKLYTAKINLDQNATKSAMNIINQVANQVGVSTQELANILASPEGLAGIGPEALGKINIDLSGEYNKMATKQDLLRTQLEGLNKLPVDPDTRKTMRSQIVDELKAVQQEMRDFDIFGMAEDMSSASKLPGKELQQRLVNMTIDSNNQLSIAMESHYKMGVGTKTFGAAKAVVKAGIDVPHVLAQMEYEKAGGTGLASKERLKQLGILEMFEDVDIIGMEPAVKMKNGVLEARRVQDAVSSYFATAIAEKRLSQQQLAELGLEQAGEAFKFRGETNVRQLLDKIQQIEGKPLEEIVAGTKRGLAGVGVSKILLSPDVHAVQAGVGRTGTITERGMYYLESLGLDDFVTDIYSRAQRATDPSAQIEIIERALSAGTNTKGTITAEAAMADGILNALYSTNLEKRKDTIAKLADGHDMAYVQLGKSVKGIDRVPVFSQSSLQPYIGRQIGGGEETVTAFDRASKELIKASIDSGPNAEERLAARASEYLDELGKVKESVAKSIVKSKVSGSMYGQATSSIGLLDELSEEMGRPMVALTESDIRRKFGAEALQRARSGNLFGIVTREPIEGVHSVVPANIRVAEDVAPTMGRELGEMEGRIFLSKSPEMRSGLMVDFDKDTVNVIAAMTDNATNKIKAFMGVGAQQTDAGAEYFKSLQRMSLLTPKFKGKDPIDMLKTADNTLSDISAAQKQLEKGSIGVFSNEFKKVHAGLREVLAKGGAGSLKSYHLGEDFSHLFVENILKSKHQGSDILKGNAMEALDVLSSRGKYATATAEARAMKLQDLFLGLVGSTEGWSKAEMDALQEISSVDNIKNVLKARDVGAKIGQDYIYKSMTSGLASKSGTAQWIDNAATVSKEVIKRGLSNFGKYAILPTAAIGFVSSLVSKPNIITPTEDAGPKHEQTGGATPSQRVGTKGTIFAIPEAPNPGFSIRGDADAGTNLAALKSMSSGMGNTKINMTDLRSKPDKFRIEELIEKGY